MQNEQQYRLGKTNYWLERYRMSQSSARPPYETKTPKKSICQKCRKPINSLHNENLEEARQLHERICQVYAKKWQPIRGANTARNRK